MILIHTSDWHIGRSLCGVSLLEDQQYFLSQFISYLSKERPDAVLIAGDLYDRPVPSAEAMTLLDDFFSQVVLELKIPVLAVAGNHDSGQRLSYEREFLAKAGLHIAGMISNPVEVVSLSDEWGKIGFHLLPWLDPAAINTLFPEENRVHTMQEAYNRIIPLIRSNAEHFSRNVLVCHGYFEMKNSFLTSEELGGAELVNLSALEDFSYIAAGHIHRKMSIISNLRYSGSILKYSPNEISNYPTVSKVEIDAEGKYRLEEISFSPLRDMRRITGKFADLLDMSPTNDYIFAELTDEELVLDPARRLKEKFPYLLGVSYQQRETSQSAFTVQTEDVRSMSVSDLFSRFYEAVTGVVLSSEAQDFVRISAENAAKEWHT
ncbi:MAG: exonuclease SbcCD subunit D [Candidatus Merdivicinus sp.]|jgi:exonuclease SbcD